MCITVESLYIIQVRLNILKIFHLCFVPVFLNIFFVSSSFGKLSNKLSSLQMERDTWRLLRILFRDRLETEYGDEGDMLMATLVIFYFFYLLIVINVDKNGFIVKLTVD